MDNLEQAFRTKWWARVAVLLAKSTLFLVLTGLSLACVYAGFHFADTKTTLSSTLLGIGGSLIASLVFTLLYSWIIDALIVKQVAEAVDRRLSANEETTKKQLAWNATELRKAVESTVAQSIEGHHGAVLRSLPGFVPNTVYPSTQGSGSGFIKHIVGNMRSGSTYIFRGITGRHVATFLSLARPSHLSCTVLLLDPSRLDLLALYIRERFKLQFEDTEQFDTKVKEVRLEILASIVSLFDVSRLVPVHIKLHFGPMYFRSELFDEEAFLSIYAGSTPTPYPWTCVFGKTSFAYQFLRKDAQECIAIRMHEATFSATSVASELENFITAIGGDPKDITSYRSLARTFDSALRTEMQMQAE